jgi:putative protease
MPDLESLQTRGYCLGFYDGPLTHISQNYEYTRTLGEWLFAGSIVQWQGDDAVFEIRNYINGGERVDFLIPNTLETLPLTLNSFEEADSGEITPRVSAGQGKKIRIRPQCWSKPIREVKRLLPQYTIARKRGTLNPEAKAQFDRKTEEFAFLCETAEK